MHIEAFLTLEHIYQTCPEHEKDQILGEITSLLSDFFEQDIDVVPCEEGLEIHGLVPPEVFS